MSLPIAQAPVIPASQSGASRRQFLGLISAAAATSLIPGCTTPEGVDPVLSTTAGFTRTSLPYAPYQDSMAALRFQGRNHAISAPLMGGNTQNSLYPINEPTSPAIPLSETGTGAYINAALASGEHFVFAANDGLILANNDFSRITHQPWSNGQNIAGGLFLAGSQLFAATSELSNLGPVNGQVQRFTTDVAGLPATVAAATSLDIPGVNPTSMSLQGTRLWVLMSGNANFQQPMLVALNPDTLEVMGNPINLVGSNEMALAQTSGTLAVDASGRYAYIGSTTVVGSDVGTGFVWRVDLQTGHVVRKTFGQTPGMHTAVFLNDGYLHVVDRNDRTHYIVDPALFDQSATQITLATEGVDGFNFDEDLGPAVINPDSIAGGVIQFTQNGATYLVR